MAKPKKSGIGIESRGKSRDPLRHKYKKTRQGKSRNSKRK